MPRACDDGTFVVEVDINAGLKWWLREARGFHMKIQWSWSKYDAKQEFGSLGFQC